MKSFQSQKKTVRDYMALFDFATEPDLEAVLASFVSPEYYWRGMHPFYEQEGVEDVVKVWWRPLHTSFAHFQRREDIFFAGESAPDHAPDTPKSVWTCSMGHFAGLFDKDWLGIPKTGKLTYIPYAEFHRVEGDKIFETALFVDIIKVMAQAGHYPLPPQTGAMVINPGPQTHDGLLLGQQDPQSGEDTIALTERMIDDLTALNKSGNDQCPPDTLSKTWHENMVWYGPAGIGATYTIPRYQKQHQYPFRENLTNKVFNGHIARFSEGNYAGWFGWPNLNNTNKGGFLGMTGNSQKAEMRVVDIYRRDGDRLAENWVFIDILHYLHAQGLDVLGRMRSILAD